MSAILSDPWVFAGAAFCVSLLVLWLLIEVASALRRHIVNRRALPAPWAGAVSRPPRFYVANWTVDRAWLERDALR